MASPKSQAKMKPRRLEKSALREKMPVIFKSVDTFYRTVRHQNGTS